MLYFLWILIVLRQSTNQVWDTLSASYVGLRLSGAEMPTSINATRALFDAASPEQGSLDRVGVARCPLATAGDLDCRRVLSPGSFRGLEGLGEVSHSPLGSAVAVLSCDSSHQESVQSTCDSFVSKGALDSATREFLTQFLRYRSTEQERCWEAVQVKRWCWANVKPGFQMQSCSADTVQLGVRLSVSGGQWSPRVILAPENQFCSIILVMCLKCLEHCRCRFVRSSVFLPSDPTLPAAELEKPHAGSLCCWALSGELFLRRKL